MKVKKSERLDDSFIKEVIQLLEKEAPITKKAACDFLNIKYNTTRLTKIVTEYKERVEREKAIRAKLKNTVVSLMEEKEIVGSFLQGGSLTSIYQATFRSLSIIKRVLKKYNVPRDMKTSKLLDLASITEDYKSGDLVYSAQYDCPAEIMFETKESKDHGRCYSIYLFGIHQYRAYQPYYELANLTEVQNKLGITIQGMTGQAARKTPLTIKD